MTTFTIIGYTVTIQKIDGKFPTGKRARRKLARRVDDTREEPRSDHFGTYSPKIKRIKQARLLVPGAGLMDAKAWVEIAFSNNGQGDII